MAPPLTPHGRVLADTLADGAWHGYHQVVDAMAAAVPPGRAHRHAEHRRVRKQAALYGAARPRAQGDETTTVTAGGRDIARRLIRSRGVEGWLEERTVDGHRQIRRTAP